MANRSRFGLVFPVALVALALADFGCGGGGGSGGTGGSAGGGGKAGHGGSGGTALGGTSGGGTSGGGISGGGTSGGGISGGGTSGGGTSGGGTSGGGTSGGGTSGGGTSGGGQGGTAGAAGAAGHPATDGGQDAARDAGATDAHHADAATDAHGDAGDAAAPTCTSACTLGSHRCAGGGSETCVMASNGCTVWGSATACQGVTTCATATGVCTCPTAPPRCTAAGTFCNTNGDLVTCSRDAQGCFSASTPQACPTDESCKGNLPNAACSCDNDPSCHGTNTFCMNAATVATCGTDSNQPACNVVVSTTTCGGSSTCVGGACVCPAAGTTAGTGCSTLNATICSGTDILTCVTQNSSGCNIWQASTHCADSGLTCGKKANSTAPACQCPENAGTDVYVDPTAGSDTASGVFPTGIQSPAACRFASITKALSVVGSPGQIIADSAALPATFSGETFPMTIPAGITLTTADAVLNAGDYHIVYGGGTPTGIVLGSGSALKGFTVDGAGAATALANCSGGTVTLDTVTLHGGTGIGDGLDVMGSCTANLKGVTITDFAGSALGVTTTGTVTMTGGALGEALVGAKQSNGNLTLGGVTVQNNGNYGVRVAGGSPSLTINNQTAITNNGTMGDFAGVSIASGSASITNTQVAGNGGAGLELASAGPYTLTTVQASNNGKSGVSLLTGNLTASGLSSTGNNVDGLTVAGGSAGLTNSTLSSNGGNGLTLSAAVAADVSGGAINGNTGAGVSASAGTLTVHGSAEIASNATGLQLTGATSSVTAANIHDNTGSGVVVDQSTGVPVAIGSSSTTTTIAKNQQQGIVVMSSPAVSGSGANSVTIDTATITGNGSFGVYLEGNDGSVAATIKSSSIKSNSDAGLMIEQGLGNTTTEAIQNNDISGNNTKASPRNVGGVLFNTSSTLTSFIGNTVHSNGGDEVGFNALPNSGTKWTITPPSNACDSTANSVYCYGSGNVGVHVLSGLASVDAQHQHWANNPATSGIDFTGTVTVTNPCTAVTTCP